MKKYELKPTDDNILITLEKDLLDRILFSLTPINLYYYLH